MKRDHREPASSVVTHRIVMLAAVILAMASLPPPATAQVAIHDDDITIASEGVLTMGHATPLYARGTGKNNPADRIVKLGETLLVGDQPTDQGRGLTLTIINATTHSHESSTNYDTWGSSSASDDLALELFFLGGGRIGVLTSADAFEANITPALRSEARRLGLVRLATLPASSDSGTWRHPYVAIFYGVTGPGHPSGQAVEIVQTNTPNAPHAILATWLMDDGFVGQALPEARPDPPCFNTTQRFVNCGNGTVTDTYTGLIYLENANCFGQQDWPTANRSAASLMSGECGLSDGSRRGDWRLPTRWEWWSIIDNFCPAVPRIKANGDSCYISDPWAAGLVATGLYWSSQSFGSGYDDDAFAANFAGSVANKHKSNNYYVWPVRGGNCDDVTC